MNRRSRGISTSSKITKASCSSKRLDSGWSKRLRRRRGAVAAQELQAGRAHGNAERQRIVVGAGGQRQRRIDRDLVGERRQGRQDARAAHDDAVLGVGDLAQGIGIAGLRRVAHRLVDGRLHDGVGERDVVAAQELLVGDQPFGAGLVAMVAPFAAIAGEARVGDVHVVGRAAHQADRILGDAAQRLAARSRSSRERGIMWLTGMGSPVSSSGISRMSDAGDADRRPRPARERRR